MPYLFSKPDVTAKLDASGNWQPKKLADEKLSVSVEENADAINPETPAGALYVEALSGKLPNGLTTGDKNGFYPVPLTADTAVLFRPNGENLFVTKAGADEFEQGQKIAPKNILVVNDAGFHLGRTFERLLGKVSVTPLHFTLANFGYGVLGLTASEAVQWTVDQLGIDLNGINPFYHLAKLFQKEPTAEEIAEALEKAGHTPENVAALEKLFAKEDSTLPGTLKAGAKDCVEMQAACSALGEKLALRVSDRFRALGDAWKRYFMNEYGGFFPEIAKRLGQEVNEKRWLNLNFTYFEGLVLDGGVADGMNNEVWATATNIINPEKSTLTARVVGGAKNGTIVPVRIVGNQIRVDLSNGGLGVGSGGGIKIEVIKTNPNGTTTSLGSVLTQ